MTVFIKIMLTVVSFVFYVFVFGVFLVNTRLFFQTTVLTIYIAFLVAIWRYKPVDKECDKSSDLMKRS